VTNRTVQQRESLAETRRNLLSSKLIRLMRLVDGSAQLAYPRRLHVPNISRQLVVIIGMRGRAASKDLVAESGREKAQISRAVKALEEAGLIDRTPSGRSMSLSASGRTAFTGMMTIARERNAVLTRGITQAEVDRFLALTAILIDRASSIFVADEKTAEIDPQAISSLHHVPKPPSDLPRSDGDESSFRDLVLPWLQSLFTYLRRSGSTVFRREVGLTPFEWHTIALIAEHPQINLATLINLVARDKSQVARMVKNLYGAGLINRRDERRVNAALTLTPAGQHDYDKMFAVSVERDHWLFHDRPAADRTFYLDILDRLTANAQALLDDEVSRRNETEDAPRAARPVARAGPGDGALPHTELQALREENARLKHLLGEAMLENALLRDRSAGRA